ncbi:MAG: surface-adhesin E family protein [Novosphingobium sp.]|uniref:surface-adhesin E family protein n=1 Tax=Novosphingobium sp. TaxID=1874826 RepID=UPI0032BB0895
MRRQLTVLIGLSICLAAVPSASIGQNGQDGQPLPETTWLPLTLNANDFSAMVFVEEPSIDRKSKSRSYIAVRVFRTIERGRRAYREHWNFDCNTNAAWFDWVEVYDGDGKLIQTVKVSRERTETKGFEPGTVGAEMLDFACSDTPAKLDPITTSPLTFGPDFLDYMLRKEGAAPPPQTTASPAGKRPLR